MSDPLSWQALEFVAALLRQITVANGYYTDLGLGAVVTETDQVPDDSAHPHTLVVAADIPVTTSGPRTVKSDMDVIIEFTVPFGVEDSAERLAHRARADIVECLRADFRGAPHGLSSLQVTGARIGQPEDGAAVVIAQVTARAGLTETKPPASR